jgi:hypothetical protein
VSSVKYELELYIPEDDILHSDRHEKLKILHESIVPIMWEPGQHNSVGLQSL